MSWITFTEDDVLAELTPGEKRAFDTLLEDDVSLPAIATKVVDRIRGAILSGGEKLGKKGTIPGSLAMDAVAIARWRFLLALPKNESLQTAERKAAHDDALAHLKIIATGNERIENPDDPADREVSLPSIKAKCRDFSKRDQEGL